MSKREQYIQGTLTIDLIYSDDNVEMVWMGKSTARDPFDFVTGIFDKLKNENLSLNLIMNFTVLEYMNSSTITPIIQFLEKSQKQSISITIRYNKTLRWQLLSFTALEIYETSDKRIQIIGEGDD